MHLFKYYRSDLLFYKAIRYNELYFSARAQLNDPNDLNIYYRFDNELNLWDVLLRSLCDNSYENLSHILDLSNLKTHKELNRIFHWKRIRGDLDSLDKLFDSYADDIRKAIYNGLLPLDKINKNIYGNESNPKQFLVMLCELGIKERLYRKIIPAVFSVSFSSNALDRMMWAHYAAGFSGCVVIYETKQFTLNSSQHHGIEVKDNLFSPHRFKFQVKPIKYSNQTKVVSLLDPTANATDLFLTKNKFWRYESEYRMFVPEANVGIENERNAKERMNRNVGHIFHHDASAIRGVIFGPRMSNIEKDEIWQIMKSNMEYTDSKLCYFFDAELSPSGKIKISKGQQAKKIQNHELFKTDMSQVKLKEVLKEIGITK